MYEINGASPLFARRAPTQHLPETASRGLFLFEQGKNP